MASARTGRQQAVREPVRSGKVAQERGLDSERRVLEACRLRARPHWMTRARLATRIEDQSGIDVVVESDVGRLLLQVKSSEHGKERFRQRPLLGIAIVVVRPTDTPEVLLRKVVGELEKVRGQHLASLRHER
jgi:hypothetical protein